jgi:urease accessory protein
MRTMLALLHLCDSLFPIGAFGYSDGLEAATSAGLVRTPSDLRDWLDVCLDEVIGRAEGPAVLHAFTAFNDRDWPALRALDAEVTALKPSSSVRLSSRAMGWRLITTWNALYPEPALERVCGGAPGLALPVAFGCACASAGAESRDAAAAFAYTRLASTISAAMRLMPIGQSDAHAQLAQVLRRVPAVVDRMTTRQRIASFTPAMDIALMSQQHLHSRLFRS